MICIYVNFNSIFSVVLWSDSLTKGYLFSNYTGGKIVCLDN